MNEDLRQELLKLRRADEKTRLRLAQDGCLFEGYAPEMERVQLRNADCLEAIVVRYGWPGFSLVGAEAAEAAWLVAQHAISNPAFQRRCLELLRDAVNDGEALPLHLAYLTDRIRFNEQRPQLFGTIFDWDEDGEMSPWQIEDPESVEERRVVVGLPPLAESVDRVRVRAISEGNRPPADHGARQQEILDWARSAGWL